ncbi:MAG TPA: MarR family winged helix-turn-helix transcriptional regulator [Gaiellales bacterium]|nr:MarR family winged helix-turn-helix transcriptional regulator [Gaiellales bacterium]
MGTPMVERVRSFNRAVTERVGALDEQFLGRGRPLGEARVLWEIGPGGVEVRELRRRLAVDSGYASRLLRSLEAQGLVAVKTVESDRRVRRACLTKTGLAERRVLDRLADEKAQSILDPLDERQRTRLMQAMEEVERLMRASSASIAAEDPATDDARWCIQQYFEELAERFDTGFDPSRSIPADPDDLRPPAGLLLLARRGEQPLGCGALKFHPGEPAELKRMWVSPEARGLGLGRRLLRSLEQAAAEAGATAIRLETNGTLSEAIALYRQSGYSEVEAFNTEPYAHHWFEKRL